MNFTKAELKKTKYYVHETHRVEMVVWIRRRPTLTSYHRVVLALCQPSRSGGLLFPVVSDIHRARLFAIDLLEAPRIHLLSLFVHTGAGRFALPKGPCEKPNQDGPPKRLFHLRLAAIPQDRLCEPSAILYGLLHQCSWLALLCLCFWRTQSWTKEFLGRRNIFSKDAPPCLVVLASPYSFLGFSNQTPE